MQVQSGNSFGFRRLLAADCGNNAPVARPTWSPVRCVGGGGARRPFVRAVCRRASRRHTRHRRARPVSGREGVAADWARKRARGQTCANVASAQTADWLACENNEIECCCARCVSRAQTGSARKHHWPTMASARGQVSALSALSALLLLLGRRFGRWTLDNQRRALVYVRAAAALGGADS